MSDRRLPSFLIGFGVGTALGLLVAPKTGDEMRAELRRGAKEGRDYVRRSSDEWRTYAEGVLEKGMETVDSHRGKLESALEAGMQAYRRAAAGDS